MGVLPTLSLDGLTSVVTDAIFGRPETKRRPVQVSTAQAMAVYLPAGMPSRGSAGVVIGRRAYGSSTFTFCPFEQHGPRLPGPNWFVLGDTGSGKTAQAQTYCAWQVGFGAYVAVLDPKPRNDGSGEGEWARITRGLGGSVIKIDPGEGGRGVVINPLDPAIGKKRRQLLMQTLLSLKIGSPLTQRQEAALRYGLRRVVTDAARHGQQATLPGLAQTLRNPDPTALRADGSDEERVNQRLARLVEDGMDLADAVDGLCEGDLAGMIDSPTSLNVDLDSHIVDFDLSAVDAESIALPILMAIIGVWLEHVWIRPGRRHILVLDEAWHVLRHPFMAHLFQRLLKFARALSLSVIAIVHHLTNVEVSAEALSLLQMAHTRTVFHIGTRKDAVNTARVLGWPRWTEEIIPTLPRGTAIWDVNGDVDIVQNDVPAELERYVFSDVIGAPANTEEGAAA
jgi:type IV secretory pathway VirB4 component